MTRVLIIEDNIKDCNALLEVIGLSPKVSLPLKFNDSHLAINLMITKQVQVDIVIISLDLKNNEGREVIKQINTLLPSIPIVAIFHDNNLYTVKHSFGMGARGFLTKRSVKSEIVYAITHIDKGNTYVNSDLAVRSFNLDSPSVSDDPSHIHLSKMQQEVLNNIADGLTNSVIGEKLFISKRIVEGVHLGLLSL
ncbi:response regulator transcription factor [Pedobacter mucosus]|uniref:response regulator transcription factor n=1 Tax=Pedobacter mucosus TaxID=2895286 RepID=UPI001EE428E2|nr:response regulator transcription factor [Pedobacter mucosus]UKT63042.1 response regulator transcription factor [Pedobacter mucosus]